MDKTKFLLILALIFAALGLLFIFQSQNSDKTRLIFCDVGQGDAILITSFSKQVLVDGGPGNKILDCLGTKMPFWDRQIEMVVLTHPQRDHMEGLIAVLERYQVKRVVTTGIGNETDVFRAWEEAVKLEGSVVHVPQAGDRFVIGRGPTPLGVEPLSLKVLWPSYAKASEGKPSIEEWRVNPPSDLNETSIVMRLNVGNPSTPLRQAQGRSGQLPSTGSGQLCAYFTGDIPKEILQGLIDRQCGILKVSHHGSKTGTSEEVLTKINPKTAIIQVGKNSYGHPHKEVIDQLKSKGVKILRNDIDGIIEIQISNGKFDVVSEN